MLERDERGPRLARSDKQAEHSSHIFSSVLALRNCFSYCLELYQTWDERPFSWMQFKFQWQNTQNDHSHTKNGSVFDGMRGLIASMYMLDMNEYEIDWNSICMDQYGSVWISMDQYGSVWISMGQYGSVWISMDQYGSVWISMDQYGSVWISMDQYGSVWISMDQYGSVWISMDQYGSVWISMDQYGSVWISIIPTYFTPFLHLCEGFTVRIAGYAGELRHQLAVAQKPGAIDTWRMCGDEGEDRAAGMVGKFCSWAMLGLCWAYVWPCFEHNQ